MSDQRSPMASSALATGHSLLCGETSSSILLTLNNVVAIKNQMPQQWNPVFN